MPIPETARQRRWSFAAEKRGEIPKGSARRWAHESKRYCEKCRKSKTGICNKCRKEKIA
jgi:hypothetical protein